eukprot:scaffold83316_cov17-Tisochrysis_lutea.AAC.2
MKSERLERAKRIDVTLLSCSKKSVKGHVVVYAGACATATALQVYDHGTRVIKGRGLSQDIRDSELARKLHAHSVQLTNSPLKDVQLPGKV